MQEEDYEVEKISERGFKALTGLCQYLCVKYDVITIKGHRELTSTRCPGGNFPLVDIRNRIFGRFDTYTVRPGDTLWSIARDNNITVEKLKQLNGLIDNTIYPNQIIKIL